MGLDLEGVDAELAALGAVPPDLEAIAAHEASTLGALDEVDASLRALEGGLSLADSPRPTPKKVSSPRLDDRRAKSGEIALGAPVYRRAEPARADPARTELVSAELSLFESDRPKSGSFELAEPDEPDEQDEQDELVLAESPLEIDAFASPRRKPDHEIAPLSLSPPDDYGPVKITPLAVDPFEGEDADAGAAPLSLFDDGPAEPNTMVTREDRDPDAEFDALFDEATHPSGIPTRNLDLDDDNLSADDLLSGLSSPDESESEAATSALFGELGLGDKTEIVSASELQGHLDPFPSEEELGSSEFEIVLDEEGTAKDIVPSQADAANQSGPDKRPSFLGRLFGRKDDKA